MKRNNQITNMNETDRTAAADQRRGALVAGVGLLLMTVASIVAVLLHGSLVVEGDAATSAANILDNALQFRLAAFSFLVVIVLDVIVAWGLYLFFRPVNRSLALLAAWLRVVYSAVFLSTLFDLIQALRILESGGAAGVPAEQLPGMALLSLNAFSDGWALSLSIFGLHLLVLGYVALQATSMPKLLSILILVAGLGYLLDAVAGLLAPDLGLAIGQFTFIGELLLALWLVVRGARRAAPEAA